MSDLSAFSDEDLRKELQKREDDADREAIRQRRDLNARIAANASRILAVFQLPHDGRPDEANPSVCTREFECGRCALEHWAAGRRLGLYDDLEFCLTVRISELRDPDSTPNPSFWR